MMSYFIEIKTAEDCEKIKNLFTQGDKISLYYREGTARKSIYEDRIFDSIRICDKRKTCYEPNFCYGIAFRFINGSPRNLCTHKQLNRIEVLTQLINKITEI